MKRKLALMLLASFVVLMGGSGLHAEQQPAGEQLYNGASRDMVFQKMQLV